MFSPIRMKFSWSLGGATIRATQLSGPARNNIGRWAGDRSASCPEQRQHSRVCLEIAMGQATSPNGRKHPAHSVAKWQVGMLAARSARRYWAHIRAQTPCQKGTMSKRPSLMHGGCSMGARTPEGVARYAAARMKHGRRRAAAQARAASRSQARSALAELRRSLIKAGTHGIEPDDVLDLMNRAELSELEMRLTEAPDQ